MLSHENTIIEAKSTTFLLQRRKRIVCTGCYLNRMRQSVVRYGASVEAVYGTVWCMNVYLRHRGTSLSICTTQPEQILRQTPHDAPRFPTNIQLKVTMQYCCPFHEKIVSI